MKIKHYTKILFLISLFCLPMINTNNIIIEENLNLDIKSSVSLTPDLEISNREFRIRFEHQRGSEYLDWNMNYYVYLDELIGSYYGPLIVDLLGFTDMPYFYDMEGNLDSAKDIEFDYKDATTTIYSGDSYHLCHSVNRYNGYIKNNTYDYGTWDSNLYFSSGTFDADLLASSYDAAHYGAGSNVYHG
jgi:hypothetical protein